MSHKGTYVKCRAWVQLNNAKRLSARIGKPEARQASNPVSKHVGGMRPVRPMRPAKGKRAGGMRLMNLSDHDSSDFLTRAYVRAGKVLESRYHKA